MSYAQLKAFHAVAASGGFSKAAARLGLSQPAVIRPHPGKLETAYGVELICARGAGRVDQRLGRSLFAITERHFESEAQAVELLSRARELEHGLIAPMITSPLVKN
jgi:DNA-binding transcriptional LysR family regulator